MDDWLKILGALTILIPVISAQIILIIKAFKTSDKIDAAAERRETIAQAVIDPSVTTLPPAP